MVTITSIKYGRLFNLGNYNNERIELEATLTEGEDPSQVIKLLTAQVNDLHKQNKIITYYNQCLDSYKRQNDAFYLERLKNLHEKYPDLCPLPVMPVEGFTISNVMI